MNALAENIMLPLGTSATSEGPIVEFKNQVLTVKYDGYDDAETKQWAVITFYEVLAYKVNQSICCDAEDLIPNKELHRMNSSEWLSKVVKDWNFAVGTHEHQVKLGGADRFSHFRLYFDDVVAIQVICAKHQSELV